MKILLTILRIFMSEKECWGLQKGNINGIVALTVRIYRYWYGRVWYELIWVPNKFSHLSQIFYEHFILSPKISFTKYLGSVHFDDIGQFFVKRNFVSGSGFGAPLFSLPFHMVIQVLGHFWTWSPWGKSALGAHVLTGCSLPCCMLTGCSAAGCMLTGCSAVGCVLTQCSLHCVSTPFAVSFAHTAQHRTLRAHTAQRSTLHAHTVQRSTLQAHRLQCSTLQAHTVQQRAHVGPFTFFCHGFLYCTYLYY